MPGLGLQTFRQERQKAPAIPFALLCLALLCDTLLAFWEKRVVQGRGKRLMVAGAAALIAGSLAAALFVLPVKAWMRQRVEIERKQEQLAVINAANAQLITDVNKLQTDDGIKEAARQNIGYVERGEVRISILPEPAAPLTLPTGWPYDAVAQIVYAAAWLASY